MATTEQGKRDHLTLKAIEDGLIQVDTDKGYVTKNGKDIIKKKQNGTYAVQIEVDGEKFTTALGRVIWLAAFGDTIPSGEVVQRKELSKGYGIDNLTLLTKGESIRKSTRNWKIKNGINHAEVAIAMADEKVEHNAGNNNSGTTQCPTCGSKVGVQFEYNFGDSEAKIRYVTADRKAAIYEDCLKSIIANQGVVPSAELKDMAATALDYVKDKL